jgi:hypothetical protein
MSDFHFHLLGVCFVLMLLVIAALIIPEGIFNVLDWTR